MQLIILSTLVAAAAASYGVSGSSGGAHSAADYSYGYSTSDPYAGIDNHVQENRLGGRTEGSYSTLLPDGRRQVVTYWVDGNSGFNAKVTYQGVARHPKTSGGYSGAGKGAVGGAVRGAVGGAVRGGSRGAVTGAIHGATGGAIHGAVGGAGRGVAFAGSRGNIGYGSQGYGYQRYGYPAPYGYQRYGEYGYQVPYGYQGYYGYGYPAPYFGYQGYYGFQGPYYGYQRYGYRGSGIY